MLTCPACGTANREGARFCYQCSAQLLHARPSTDDTAWLAATLGASQAVDLPPAPLLPPAAPAEATAQREKTMDTAQNSPEAPLFAGRYELSQRTPGEVEALDRQPWQRCWACGATSNEAGELYCIECGASLEGRRYRGQLAAGDKLTGLALVPLVTEPATRELLPEIWDQAREDESTLTLVADSGRPALTPPLGDLEALQIGRGLARLLRALHGQGLALGALAPEDIELAPSGQPRLRDVPGLHTVEGDKGVDTTADLRALAALLEALTATPRTTQRLAEDQAEALAVAANLPEVLRDLRTGAIGDAAALEARLDDLIAERTSPRSLAMRVGASSHEGMVRELDEDSLLALELQINQTATPRTWGLFIVADGMGGHAAGEVASGLAIRGAAEVVLRAYLAPTLEADQPYDEERVREVVLQAIRQANEYVLREAQTRGNDMGTTITMALVVGDRAVVGNVGDSRTYIYRDGQLRRVSRDHSLVMRLVELGQITDEEVYTHPQRNAVLRSLGDKPEVEIDLFTERLKPGDALFLCSDGQWEMTRDPHMAELIAKHDDPQAACEALIEAGNAAGGEDNITAVLVRFEAAGA